MNITAEKINGICKMQIEGEMTIFNAEELKEKMFAGMKDCAAVELDLSKVNEMDTSGFQLLYLASRDSALLNRAFSIKAQGRASENVLELFNMKTEEF